MTTSPSTPHRLQSRILPTVPTRSTIHALNNRPPPNQSLSKEALHTHLQQDAHVHRDLHSPHASLAAAYGDTDTIVCSPPSDHAARPSALDHMPLSGSQQQQPLWKLPNGCYHTPAGHSPIAEQAIIAAAEKDVFLELTEEVANTHKEQ